MSTPHARTLKGPRRFVSRVAHRVNSPKWQFLRGFLKNPVMVGSVIPSSKVLIDKMLGPVKWDETKLFVEYGPGVGTFTKPVLDRLGKNGTLLAIDTNPDFVDYLRKQFPDPRLIVVLGSAADVEQIVKDNGFDHADFVLSGLPFSTLPPGVGDAIGSATARVHARRRRVPCLPVQSQGARLHRALFRAA